MKLWRKHELQIVQVYNPKPKAKIRTDIDKKRTIKLLMKNEEDKNKIIKNFQGLSVNYQYTQKLRNLQKFTQNKLTHAYTCKYTSLKLAAESATGNVL